MAIIKKVQINPNQCFLITFKHPKITWSRDFMNTKALGTSPLMGVYDRDYYKTNFNSSFEKGWGNISICKWLIGINIVIFILQISTRTPSGSGLVTDWLILNPSKVIDGEIWRVFSYAFLHSMDSPLHLLMNMMVLWMFGKEVEDVLGAKEFLLFYVVSIIIGGITFVVGALLGLHNSQAVCLGASGGVSAILILFACWFPNRTVLLFFIIPMPIWLMAVLFVGFDAFNLLSGKQGSVAVEVHLSGALFAYLYHAFRWKLIPRKMPSMQLFKRKPKLKLYQEEVHAYAPKYEPKEIGMPQDMLIRVDQILEKISLSGKDSLSEEEKTFLYKASETIKRKKN